MTPEDTAKLLAAAAMFDYRKADRDDILMWHSVIGDLAYDDAIEAVRRHYAESTERMMPAHIRAGVRAIRNERAEKTPSEARALPSPFEDDADRAERGRRGSAQVHEVLAVIAKRMKDRGQGIPGDALEQLRELAASDGGEQ
ncbi:hypothetical protein GCM10010172_06460 [Paractinoplanes ferrugineus]|uniref:Uncharacterized protein n=1 Tax=Paractinoplanes ferrugineus TaxID=113564 RepID=A0A919JFM5_9ACTN|nr:hypothetical protein [Actinoplanes ferrugineus]GIE16326.1 hypothetical protein Afe05nite_81660 [Actinoplanes ferrugineus]